MDDDLVFKALADRTRRFLLDRLFRRDGRTLTELASELEMTRFGVMKHLRLLEAAGLVVPRVWQPLFPLGCCRSSVKIFAVPRNMALVFPIRLTGGINETSDTSPPTSLKLPRDSVGDWGRTLRALPTI